jgi:hypothetical protein
MGLSDDVAYAAILLGSIGLGRLVRAVPPERNFTVTFTRRKWGAVLSTRPPSGSSPLASASASPASSPAGTFSTSPSRPPATPPSC